MYTLLPSRCRSQNQVTPRQCACGCKTNLITEDLSFMRGGFATPLIDSGFVASPSEPLRVSEFQTHHRTRLDEARGGKVLGFG